MKIQLIRPPLDWWYESTQIAGLISFPIGLLILATKLKNQFSNSISVEVLDGLFLKLEDVLARIDGDWVGVYNIYANHLNCLKILETAKNKGAKTIIGGPNAGPLAERILANRPYIDFVVYNDGEEAIVDLIKGKNQLLIPNLVYRQNEQIVRNPEKSVDMNMLFDLENIAGDLDQYLARFNRQVPVPLSSIRGCAKAIKSKRCLYCSMSHELKIMQPELVWRQIDLLYKKYGCDFFYESGDCFNVGDFPERLLVSRPKNLESIGFKVYMRPEDAKNKSFIETLKLLNVREIFLGIETVNDNLLKIANRTSSQENIEQAVKIISNFADIHASFMYGLPGETIQTAQNTFEFARELVRKYLRKIRVVSHFPVPFAGSEFFEILKSDERIRRECKGDLAKDDKFDYQKLLKIYTKYYCSVDFRTLEQFIIKTLSLVPGQATSFGINQVPIL